MSMMLILSVNCVEDDDFGSAQFKTKDLVNLCYLQLTESN